MAPRSPGSPGSPSSSAILPLDSKAIFAFQRDGHHAEALHAIASSVASVQAAHGKHSLETVKISLVGARLCNELALSSMQRGAAAFSFDAAFEYLQRAMRMPDVSLALRAVTLNNLSIYYARTGQPHAALRCLQRVVKQSSTAAHADDVSVHVALNLTTVLADLGRHREALETAHGAVRSLTERARPPTGVGASGAPARPDASLLSAAYHNLAVQQERLGHTQGQIASYKSALHLVKRAGGDKDSPMVQFVQNAYAEAKRRAANPPPRPASAAVATAPPPPPRALPPRPASQPGGSRPPPAAAGRLPAIASPKPSVLPPYGAPAVGVRPKTSGGGSGGVRPLVPVPRGGRGGGGSKKGRGRGRQKTVEEVFLGAGAGLAVKPSQRPQKHGRPAPPYGASNTAVAPTKPRLAAGARVGVRARIEPKAAGPGRTRVRVRLVPALGVLPL